MLTRQEPPVQPDDLSNCPSFPVSGMSTSTSMKWRPGSERADPRVQHQASEYDQTALSMVELSASNGGCRELVTMSTKTSRSTTTWNYSNAATGYCLEGGRGSY
jgi:hypothetical protein